MYCYKLSKTTKTIPVWLYHTVHTFYHYFIIVKTKSTSPSLFLGNSVHFFIFYFELKITEPMIYYNQSKIRFRTLTSTPNFVWSMILSVTPRTNVFGIIIKITNSVLAVNVASKDKIFFFFIREAAKKVLFLVALPGLCPPPPLAYWP